MRVFINASLIAKFLLYLYMDNFSITLDGVAWVLNANKHFWT